MSASAPDRITLTLDELADVLRHYLHFHSGKMESWDKLPPWKLTAWRDAAKTAAAGALSRRAEIAAAERRRG